MFEELERAGPHHFPRNLAVRYRHGAPCVARFPPFRCGACVLRACMCACVHVRCGAPTMTALGLGGPMASGLCRPRRLDCFAGALSEHREA